MESPIFITMKHDAFISYSHSADGKFSPALEDALKKIAKPFYKIRALNVFRDETNLSATPHLWDTIKDNLLASDYFILLASPKAAQSQWVKKEVQCWLESQSEEKILIGLTEGEIVWNEKNNDFDWERSNALPKELKSVFKMEPLYVDFRGAKATTDLSSSNADFRNKAARIAATIHGKPLRDILSEDVRTQRQRIFYRNLFLLSLSILLGLAIFFWIQSSKNAEIAEQERFETEKRLRAFQFKEAADAISSVNPALSLRLMEKALELDNNELIDDAILDLYQNRGYEFSFQKEGHQGIVSSAVFSLDGKTILTSGWDKTIRTWDLDGNELQRFYGHSDRVNCVLYSPDGKQIASCSDDGSLRLWSLDGHEIERISGHQLGVSSIAFSPDGQKIVSCSKDRTIRVWNLEGRELLLIKKHTQAVRSVSFSPDGKWILSGSEDGTARIWDLNGNEVIPPLVHDKSIFSVGFHPSENIVLTGGEDGIARIWTTSGQFIQSIPVERSPVTSVAFSPDGQSILVGTGYDKASLFDLNGQHLLDYPGHYYDVLSCSFSQDGSKVLTTCIGTWIWDTSGNCLGTIGVSSVPLPSILAVSPRGDRLITCQHDTTFRIWDGRGTLLGLYSGHKTRISSISFSSDGEHFVTGATDSTAILWNLDGEKLQTFSGHNGYIKSVALSPDMDHLLSGGTDNAAFLWNLQGQKLANFVGHSAPVNFCTFSPNGQFVLTGSSDKTVRLWDLKGNELEVLRGHNEYISSIDFSSDGKEILTSSSDKTVKRWNIEGKLLNTYGPYSSMVKKAVFSGNGTGILLGCSDGSVKLIDLSGKLLWQHKVGVENMSQLEFSKDQKYAYTSYFNEVKLSTLPGIVSNRFSGHHAAVNDIAFSPDGQAILTASRDSSFRLWSNRGEPLGTISNKWPGIKSCAFSPDGKMFVIGHARNRISLLEADGKLVREFSFPKSSIDHVRFTQDGTAIIAANNNFPVCMYDLEGKEKMRINEYSISSSSIGQESDKEKQLNQIAKALSIRKRILSDFKDQRTSFVVSALHFEKELMAKTMKDNNVWLFDFEGNRMAVLVGHQSRILDIAFSTNGEFVLTSSDDGTLRLWNLKGDQLYRFSLPEKYLPLAAFSSDDQYVFTTTAQGDLYMWERPKPLQQFLKDAQIPDIEDLLISSDPNTVDYKALKSVWNLLYPEPL
jgi:WD40 repeat protein